MVALEICAVCSAGAVVVVVDGGGSTTVGGGAVVVVVVVVVVAVVVVVHQALAIGEPPEATDAVVPSLSDEPETAQRQTAANPTDATRFPHTGSIVPQVTGGGRCVSTFAQRVPDLPVLPDPRDPGRRPRTLGPVRVLVLSDTHLSAATLDRLPTDVWAMADEADLILHAGDVVDPAVLAALGERAALQAVLGNNDHGLERVLPEVWEGEVGGVAVGMVHDSGPTAGRARRLRRRFPDARVVVFGHSHDPLVEPGDGDQLLVNPGSPTQRRRQPVHTVAWLELVDGEVRGAELRAVGPLAASSG
jgi:putative phosphoesterase